MHFFLKMNNRTGTIIRRIRVTQPTFLDIKFFWGIPLPTKLFVNSPTLISRKNLSGKQEERIEERNYGDTV